jgi:S1-C subfamily serine protease
VFPFRTWCILFCFSACIFLWGNSAFAQLLQQVEKEFIVYAATARRSCVKVNVTQKVPVRAPVPLGRSNRKVSMTDMERSLSGTLLDEKGYVVTLAEALVNAVRVSVSLVGEENSLRRYKADVIGLDLESNLGLLRIQEMKPFATLPLGDSSSLAQGALVMGLGFSYDLGPSPSFSVGMVNALDRSFKFDEQKEKLNNLIQTSMALRPGEPGGPVVNTSLEVVGMLLATYPRSGVYPPSLGLGQQGVTVVMPMNLIKKKVDRILAQHREEEPLRKETQGTVWLGITAGNITDQALRKQLVIPAGGVLITDVYPGDPAALAGVCTNDVLVTWNSTAVTDLDHLKELVGHTQVGDKVRLLVIRGGEKHEVEVVVGRY